jgi:membrane protein YdbS with pleckstrin-like domain
MDDAEAGDVAGGADTPLSPRVVALWRLSWAIVTAILLLPTLLLAAFASDLAGWIRVGLPSTVLVLGGLATGLIPALTYRRWRYGVTADGVELRHGVLVHHESSIPHFRVQHIDLQQGPLDRWRNVVKVSISTASPATDATLPGIEPERAAELRARILERAEADDGV